MSRHTPGAVDAESLREHLRFASELGLSGASRDPWWRVRESRGIAMPVASIVLDTASPRAALAVAGQDDSKAGRPASAESLDRLRMTIGPDCQRCKLHALGRTQVVFGVGNANASLMFVGEAPGGDEDAQGVPFVGRAGQLLTRIIEAMGLKRDDVYIANVIKCRPPGNRNPEPDEVETCEPFLFEQIDAIKPKAIVALGKFAAQALLRTADPISRLRGRVFEYRGAKLIPTFHPAYVLRNPSSKREVWDDMKLVMRLLAETP
mgnify:CR=1 FL=1